MTKCDAALLCALLVATPSRAQIVPGNELGVSFAHTHLSTTDLEAHAALWAALFGGVVLEEAGYTAVEIPGGQIFFTEQEPTAPSIATSADHFGLKVRELDAVLTGWRSRGYAVDEEWTSAEGLSKAFVTMPDGVRLELEGDPGLSTMAEMHHVHLYAPDHQALLAWYVELFGGETRTRGDIETTADVPGVNLSFSHSDHEREPTDGTAIDHIGFEVEDIAAFAERLESRGIEIVFGPRYIESLDLWVAFFTDPSGVFVEVTEGLDHFGR